jgi:hypothetical protein
VVRKPQSFKNEYTGETLSKVAKSVSLSNISSTGTCDRPSAARGRDRFDESE